MVVVLSDELPPIEPLELGRVVLLGEVVELELPLPLMPEDVLPEAPLEPELDFVK
ncbi:MAG TPA: hypothetical protein VIV54_22545 [Burkholderiales bacterium]